MIFTHMQQGSRIPGFGEHIGIHIAQKLATRAFAAVEKMLFGKARRVRFKKINQLDSIEGKNNQTGLIWKGMGVRFRGRLIPAVINSSDLVIAYGLSKRVKYCRLVKKRIRATIRFFIQLICEGKPLSLKERKILKSSEVDPDQVKVPVSQSSVGLDIGPSTVAIVTEEKAGLHQLCSELQINGKIQRRLQRKLDRQRRANNSQNFEANGTVKPGAGKWKVSRRQQKTQQEFSEMHGKIASHRRSLHGNLINQEIPLGSEIRIEIISYRSFQRNFGKSVGIRSPGMFIERLKQKAANASGSVVEFSTFQTRLSQTCLCGQVQKKPLSQRVHECPCGVRAQRDLFSGFGYLPMKVS